MGKINMIKAGNKEFKNKTALQTYCKSVLLKSDGILQGEDLLLLIDVLHMHETWQEKVGVGSFTIGVRKCNINPRNKQFYIIRENGDEVDFSYYKAISGYTGKESRIKSILRESIKNQTVSYKDDYFNKNQDSKGYIVCPETKLKIKKKDSHLDHYPKQFDEIIKDWVESRGLTSDKIDIKMETDGKVSWYTLDESLLNDFTCYHKEVASYRVVLNKVNQQRKKSTRFTF